MSTKQAYKGYKQRRLALEKTKKKSPAVDDTTPKGFLAKKKDSGSQNSSDMTDVIAKYIEAIRDL